MEAAELHNMNGSYRVAREYLNQAKQVLEGGDFMKDITKGRYELALGETLTGQGYYNEAIELLVGQERFYAGRAVKQETFVDDKGNLKSRKLTSEELVAIRHRLFQFKILTGKHLSNERELSAGRFNFFR